LLMLLEIILCLCLFFFILKLLQHSNPATIPEMPPKISPTLKKTKLQELTELSEQDIPLVLSTVTIDVYYRDAESMWRKATTTNQAKDFEKAYVCYLRFSTFVLHHIPKHLSYNTASNTDNKVLNRTRCNQALKEITELQEKISTKYNERIENSRKMEGIEKLPPATNPELANQTEEILLQILSSFQPSAPPLSEN